MKHAHRSAVVLSVALALAAPAALAASTVPAPVTLAQAQGQTLTLAQAIATAFKGGPDLVSAGTSLANAKADLAAKEADPTSVITTLTQARNSVTLSQAQLAATRLNVLQSVINAYTALYEAQENLKVLQAQVDYDNRNLQVAKAKLTAKAGTALDVSKAEATLASDQQSLANAKAQIPILSNKLEPLLGLPATANVAAVAPPASAYAVRKLDGAALEDKLEDRLVNLVQARQAVEFDALNVQLSNNDYTPAATLRGFQTDLANDRLSLTTAQTNAVTSLRDAERAVNDAAKQLGIRAQSLANAQESLKQDETRYRNGLISKVQLEGTQLSVTQAQFGVLQAQDAYLKSLAALSVASGTDVTGLSGVSEAS